VSYLQCLIQTRRFDWIEGNPKAKFDPTITYGFSLGLEARARALCWRCVAVTVSNERSTPTVGLRHCNLDFRPSPDPVVVPCTTIGLPNVGNWDSASQCHARRQRQGLTPPVSSVFILFHPYVHVYVFKAVIIEFCDHPRKRHVYFQHLMSVRTGHRASFCLAAFASSLGNFPPNC
jgi:hypothetical protein